MSGWTDWIAALLVVGAAAGLTLVVVRVVRTHDGPTARHFANVALPLGFLPLFCALALAGPYDALGTGALVVLFQFISSAAESHTTVRLAWMQRKQRKSDQERPSASETSATRQSSDT